MRLINYLWGSAKGRWSLFIIVVWILFGVYAIFPSRASGGTIYKTSAGYMSPLSTNEYDDFHLLGTDLLGRDVAAGLVDGAFYSLALCTIVLTVSLLFGIVLGLLSGYYGNVGLKANIYQIVIALLFASLCIYVSVYNLGSLLYFALLTLVSIALWRTLGKFTKKNIKIPIDTIIMKLVEIKNSLPALIIILFFVGVFPEINLVGLALVLSIFYHLTFARYIRNETQIQRNMDYVASAQASGLSDYQIMFRHILPNVIAPVIVVVTFSLSSIILLESTLSFLGIGISVDEITWGKILAQARSKTTAWWMAIFPGLCISLLIYAFNNIGNIISEYLSGHLVARK